MKRSPPEAGTTDPDPGFVEPVAERTSPLKAAGCGAAFFGVFLLAGLGFLLFFLLPALRVFEARSWDPVPCEILESSVRSHRGDDSTTYSVDVRYRYSVAGREYTAERYEFLGGSSSGYEGKKRVVDELPPGTETTCWVDPEDPSEAVLHRGFSWPYLFALLPLVFIAVGGIGAVASIRTGWRVHTGAAAGAPGWLPRWKGRRDRGSATTVGGSPRSAARRPAPAVPALEPGRSVPALPDPPVPRSGEPLVLEPAFSPVGKLATITLVALFWNGIVSVFVWQLWEGWRAGSPDGCLTLFLIPFVLIGAVLLVGIPYQFLALFNPRPRLVLSPGRLTVGGQTELRWSFSGDTDRIRELRIRLEGCEEADYTQGTDRRTASEVFATLEVLRTTSSTEIADGATTLSVPADTMHSFDAPDNRIEWALKLQGTIRFWPDVIEELPLVIEPLPLDRLPDRPLGRTSG